MLVSEMGRIKSNRAVNGLKQPILKSIYEVINNEESD